MQVSMCSDTGSDQVLHSSPPPCALQEDVFTEVGKPLVEHAVQGYNACCFAYGQTGSGKTYSMFGKETGEHDLRGMIPRAAEELFKVWIIHMCVFSLRVPACTAAHQLSGALYLPFLAVTAGCRAGPGIPGSAILILRLIPGDLPGAGTQALAAELPHASGTEIRTGSAA
jgi:hypothetical protein